MIFVGHSHMICVLEAAEAAGLPFRAITLKDINTPGDVASLRTRLLIDRAKPDFADDTKALIADSRDPVFSFVSGVQHVQMGIRRLSDPSEPPFDFILPEAPQMPLDPEAEVVPFECVCDALAHAYRNRFKMMARVAALAPGRMCQFAPPPPAPQPLMAAFTARKGVPGAPVPSAIFRRKLWRATVHVFRRQTERLGIRFLDCPPEAIDEDGCMREELVRNLTHGNAAFGALVLEQIRGVL